MYERKLRLHGWGERLTCFTAALGTWLADRCEAWWRPLLDRGPTLIVSRRVDCWMFEHAAHPWMPGLGLEFTGSDDWDEVSGALLEEIECSGSVIVAADVYGLPWHRGHLRWHAPHWLVVREDAGRACIEDPLDMTTPEGPQSARLVSYEWDQLREIARALHPVSKIFQLREQSIAGAMDLSFASRYRWLRRRSPSLTPVAAYGSLRGPAACRALADYYEAAGADERAYAQSDDLWQAVRQRELAAAAAGLEPMTLGIEGKRHWEAAVAEWRRIPPLLMHAKLRAQSGAADPARHLSAALRRLGDYEDRMLFESEPLGNGDRHFGVTREAGIHA